MSEPSDRQLTDLLDALGEAQRIGMLGPGSLDLAIRRAWAFVDRCPKEARSFVDLGTGGGLPKASMRRLSASTSGPLRSGRRISSSKCHCTVSIQAFWKNGLSKPPAVSGHEGSNSDWAW